MELNDLNKEQKEAVLYNEGPLLIIAGAGSGKTRVITYKVAYLISGGIDPSSILAITFTNKAASEMKERTEKLIGNKAKLTFISTFHKFCGRLLRVFIDKIGYSRDFTIYDTDDVKKLIDTIIKDFGYDEKKIKAKVIASKISYCKNHNIDIDEFAKMAKSDIDKIAVKVFKEYVDRMFNNNALDFDDMLLLTVKLLKTDEDVRKSIANKFKYILVDEYQDTNLVQFEIIRLLTKDKNNYLTVVGDDDQSIYKFRGADITNILEFEDNFDNAKTIKLTQNYRSTNNILNVANSVIKNNTGRKEKKLWSDNGIGNEVTFTEYEDDVKEAYNIIKEIKKRGEYKNTAILYRTNAQSRKFEEMCVSFSLPYTLIGGVEFYARKEIKDVLSYMHVVSNSNDVANLFRIINVPKRGLGDTTINKIVEYANENGLKIYDVLSNIDSVDIKQKAKDNIKEFISLINNLKEETEIDVLIEKILENGYKDYIISEYDAETAKDRLNNIEELKNKATTFKNTYPEFIDSDVMKEFAENDSVHAILPDFLNEVALVADTDKLNSDDDKITLMSLHASKGLEYDNVYLTGMNEGVFPSYQAITSDDKYDIEEERRLCYVGITRAKRNLFLTAARRRMQNGKFSDFQVSRFVDEIDNKQLNKKMLTKISVLDSGFSNGDRYWGYGRDRHFNNYRNTTTNNNIYVKDAYNDKSRNAQRIDLTNKNNLYKMGASIEKAITLDYKEGDRVTHTKFGDGVVTNITDIGRDYQVTVCFDDTDVGEKTLFATFAKLKGASNK